jgi:hypothetical protein
MPIVKTTWVKKTLGLGLAFFFSALTIYAPFHTQTALAHAEHGSEGGIPTVSAKAKLPKGVSLQVVKSTAYQFALSTDGQQKIEILGEDKRAFLRFDGNKLYADLNATGWHRSRQPGGGPVPDRLKQKPAPKANWVLLDQQPGYGWYDPRLLNEELAHFNLELRINGKPANVRIERQEQAPMTGYWRPTLKTDSLPDGLNAMVPGLSGNMFMLSRLATAESEFQVLDDKGLPFLELRDDGVWLDGNHPWAKQTELFYTLASADSPWVKVSETGTITYAEPRLDNKPKTNSQTGRWTVPVRMKGGDKTSLLEGEMTWQRIEQPK